MFIFAGDYEHIVCILTNLNIYCNCFRKGRFMPVKDMFDPEDEMTKVLIDDPEAFPSGELTKKELDVLRKVLFATPNYTRTQTNKYLQGSHSDWKTWKNVKELSSQGKVEQTGKVRKSHTKHWKK